MATSFQGQEARSDLYKVDPFAVELVEELRGRAFPPTDAQIEDLAISMLEVGQLQPSKARHVGNKKLAIVAGFTRTAAARLIRLGFERDGVTYHDPEFLLSVTVGALNDKESFLANVAENAIRNQTSPIDDAINQRTARERYGLTNAEIANRYRCSADRVRDLEKLLSLDDAERELVHHGGMSVEAALQLVNQPVSLRRGLIEQWETNGKRIKLSDVKDAKRSLVLSDKKDEGQTYPVPTPTGSLSRTYKEMKQFLADMDPDDKRLRNLRDTMLLWCEGKCDDKRLRKAFNDTVKELK